MNNLSMRALRNIRRVAKSMGCSAVSPQPLRVHYSGQAASDAIRGAILAPKPCLIGRIGNTEFRTILPRLYAKQGRVVHNAIRYVLGKQGEFWWDDSIRNSIRDLSGVFPATNETLARFADCYLDAAEHIDILGSWIVGEANLAASLRRAILVPLEDLEPYFHKDPWTTALESRRVLVLHPFEESIREQYNKRSLLFQDPRVLPDFELISFKTVQSLGGDGNSFKSWFDALKWMCDRISEIDFDIALIGAGAYGLPLAAFIKSIGKKAVHLGGATQLLFGIRGKRWDESTFYRGLYNEHWIRPRVEERPEKYLGVESGCYW